MSADVPAPNEYVERLLDEGTGCYARGDVEGAVNRWREVLEVEPGNGRAQAWLDRVRGELIEAFDGEGSEASSDALRGAELELPELEEELGSLVGDDLAGADSLAAAEAALDAVAGQQPQAPALVEDPQGGGPAYPTLEADGDDLGDWLGDDFEADTRLEEVAADPLGATEGDELDSAEGQLAPELVGGQEAQEAAPLESAASAAPPQSLENDDTQEEEQGPLAQAVACFQAGEILKAYALVEARLEEVPEDSGAQAFMDRMRPLLAKELDVRVGPLTATPRVAVTEDVLMWLHLNHRAGFILSQVDGFVTFEDILDLSGMDRFSTLRILAQLLDDGVITR